ncbi:MAG: PAS domain S-box protein [Desulfobulbaceae bacterium]|nr:PAS domain S-box protein [Desulfobulbaceae bacterium]HIJ91014.1 PAS domain S-box protein [Deltaproteobacteria bacterium]
MRDPILKRSRLPFGWPMAMAFCVLALLATLGWLTAEWRGRAVDAEMRAHLVRQAVEVAQNINPALVKKLSFSSEDMDNPAFFQIHEQMTAIGRSFNHRGIYSLALRDGTLFFGPENYLKNDPMANPPGTAYRQSPGEFLRLFTSHMPITMGPYTDKYGTFVSAAAPVLDPHSGEVLMLIGINVLADDWQARIDRARRAPLLSTLLVLLLLPAGFIAIRRRKNPIKPQALRLKAWILTPVFIAMLGSIAFLLTYEYQHGKEESQQVMLQLMEQSRSQWRRLVISQVQLLKAQMDHAAVNPSLAAAWKAQDLNKLTDLSLPIAAGLRQEYRITHFYFIAPDRTVFLRAHHPAKRGDIIDRHTLLAAARTGEDAWGLELGPLGTFTLRYVRPWLQDGRVTGYLELGMEIEHLVTELAADLNVDFLTLVRKEFTSREKFEAGRKNFGFVGHWDDFSNFVVAHQTITELSDSLRRRLQQGHTAFSDTETIWSDRQGGKTFWYGVLHQPDVAGRDVADLILLRDMTLTANAAKSKLVMDLGLTAVMAIAIFALLWTVTSKAEGQLAYSFTNLQEREEHLSVTLDSIGDAVIATDTGKRIVRMNPMAEQLTGWPLAQAKGLLLSEVFRIINAQTRKPVSDPVDQVLASGKVVTLSNHTTLVARNNAEYQITDSAAPIRDSAGNTLGVVLVFRNVTDEYQARQARIRDAEEIARLAWHNELLLTSIGEGIYGVDLSGHATFINPAALSMLGLNADELIGQDQHAVFHHHRPDGSLYPAKECPIRKTLKDGLTRHEENEWFLRKNGTGFPVALTVTPLIKDSTQIGVVVVFRDISERRRAEQALRQSQASLENAQRIAHLGNWEWDIADNILSWSNETYLIFGLAPHEFESNHESYLDYVHPEDRAAVQQAVRNAVDRNAPYSIEHRVQRPDGGLRWVHQQAEVLRDTEGKPLRMCGTVQDITERKTLETQLFQARKMEAVGVLAGGIAHDFNNILTPIMMHTQMILMNTPADAAIHDSLVQVRKAADRARELVRQILDFSRQGQHKPHPLKMGPVVKEAVKFLRSTIPSVIDLECRIQTDNDLILADPTQMLQVVMNLTINGAQSMRGRSGKIAITLAGTEKEATLPAPFGITPGTQKWLKLTVSDTGEGIPPELLGRIFEPYFTTKEKGEGTGMGLAVVHGIVEKHGGLISARSTPGLGTDFEVLLPLIEAENVNVPALNQPLPGGNERILLVDDEQAVVEAMAPMLSLLGYRVTPVGGSLAALDLFRSGPDFFDLVITDLAMPNMTGADMATEMLRIRPDIPVILCTGFSEEMNEKNALAMGIAAFINKPFGTTEIADLIRRVLSKRPTP